MAGTTCSAAVFVMRSTVVAEKGWTITNLAGEKRDAFVSAFMMLFLSGVIMAVAAGTLHVIGMRLDNTVDMVHLFEPIGGKVAAFILILGVSGAGLSTVFPIVLIAPWLICDYTGRPRDIHSPLFRVLGFAGILFGLGTLFLAQRPPAIMIFSQAFQACILPAVAIPILVLINRSREMREYTANSWMNSALVAGSNVRLWLQPSSFARLLGKISRCVMLRVAEKLSETRSFLHAPGAHRQPGTIPQGSCQGVSV